MSICRTTVVEYYSEKDADESVADYTENGPSLFTEAEIMLSARVGPTTVVTNSVYTDKETAENTMAKRQAFIDRYKNRIKSFETYVGEVTLSEVR